MRLINKVITHTCCVIIITVAAIDTYWLSKNRDIIHEVEQNPIGKYLIGLDNGDVSLFILCKFIGTYMSIAVVYWLWPKYPRKSNAIAISLATIQIFLLFYLYHIPSTLF